jgi:hypothetical protein
LYDKPTLRLLAAKERLYDIVSVYLGDQELIPAYLSSMEYMHLYSLSWHFNMSFLKTADEEGLRTALRVPMTSSWYNIRHILKSYRSLSDADGAGFLRVAKDVGIPTGRIGKMFWRMRSTVAIYGPYAVTFSLIHARGVDKGRGRIYSLRASAKTTKVTKMRGGPGTRVAKKRAVDDRMSDEEFSGDETMLPSLKKRKGLMAG